MPVEFIKKINDRSSWVLWKIDEEIGHFLLMEAITRADRDELGTISNHYKKLEWLATRAAAHALLQDRGNPYEGIYKDSHGKPHLIETKGQISVTHSYPYVAVIYHEDETVGIDLELPREKILKISPKFLSDSELENAGQDVKKTTIYWSAKESLFKLHGRKFVIFIENLAISPFSIEKEGILQSRIKINGQSEDIDLQYECYEEFVVTYSIR
jgi:phosphopantetheinyl transferase